MRASCFLCAACALSSAVLGKIMKNMTRHKKYYSSTHQVHDDASSSHLSVEKNCAILNDTTQYFLLNTICLGHSTDNGEKTSKYSSYLKAHALFTGTVRGTYYTLLLCINCPLFKCVSSFTICDMSDVHHMLLFVDILRWITVSSILSWRPSRSGIYCYY